METAQQPTLQTYPAYKPSGVEWLGDIPEGWEAVKMKYLFRDISIKGKPEETLLSVTQNQGVIPRDWVENRMVMPSGNLETFKFIRKGDFAISLRSFEGGLEYCYHDGIISPAYTVLKMKSSLVSEYYKYLLKSKSFISEIQTSVIGIREGKNISYPELSYSLLPVPSAEEQTAIANFLDVKTQKIDAAIVQKQQLITLLKERKQILIQDLVTGKKVWDEATQSWKAPAKTKDSGVEWIGEIPEGWGVKKLTHSVRKLVDGTHFSPKSFESGDYKYITAKNIKQSGFDFTNLSYITQKDHDTIFPRCPVSQGDVLYIKDGATAGIAMVNTLTEEFSLLSSVALIRPNLDIISAQYLSAYLNSDVIRNFIKTQIVGGALTRLTLELISRFKIIAPSQKEQNQIVQEIQTQSSKIDKAIGLQEQQIEKLQEYKRVLVDSCVRGKVKVS